MQVDQFLSILLPQGDGISDAARAIRNHLSGLGHGCDIYVRFSTPQTAMDAIPLDAYRAHAAAVRLLHYSDESLVDFVIEHQLPIHLLYHNITPAHFFSGFDETTYRVLHEARARLPLLIPFSAYAAGNSRYSECELRQLGFNNTGTFMLDISHRFDGVQPDPQLLRQLANHPILLFVGRLAPNKRQDDLIKLLWVYRQLNPGCQLYLVGSIQDGSYAVQLRRLAHDLGLKDQVHFCGHVTQAELLAYYHSASVFVSMSEHEGFGIPLMESMLHALPVVAYASTAVTEVVQGAGVLVRHKRFEEWAFVLHHLVHDVNLRRQVIAAQNQRLQEYSTERWVQSLQRVLDQPQEYHADH